MSKFKRMNDGQVNQIDWKKKYLCYACCDCGMAHSIEFDVEGDVLYFTYVQNPKATGQLRRHAFGNLHGGVRGYLLTKQHNEGRILRPK